METDGSFAALFPSLATLQLGRVSVRVGFVTTQTQARHQPTPVPLVFPFFNWIQKISNRVIFLLQLEARV